MPNFWRRPKIGLLSCGGRGGPFLEGEEPPMRGGLIIGVDAGTTALKVVLLDPERGVVARASAPVDLSHPRPEWVEADAEEYWVGLCRAVREALGRAGARGEEVAALAISSQGETLIAVDGRLRPLRPAIVWLDARAKGEAKRLRRRLSKREVYRRFGMPELFHNSWPPLLRWLRRHEPEVFQKARKFLLVGEFLVARLTGEFAGDVSTRASTCLYDQFRLKWDEEALELSGLDESRLPRVGLPGEPVG